MLRRRVCGASHNTVDSITGKNAGGWGVEGSLNRCGTHGMTN